MTEQELQALKEQIKRELLEEKEQEKRNKNVFAKIMNEVCEEFSNESDPYSNHKLYKLRTGMSAVVRWAFGGCSTAEIPAEREQDVRELVKGIIELCKPFLHENKTA